MQATPILPYNDNEDWDCYIERFESFLTANGLKVPSSTVTDTSARIDSTDSAKATEQNAWVVALLLNALGSHYYGVVRDLVSPAKPAEKTYDELKITLRKHLKRTPVVMAERRKFIRRDQTSAESTSDYVLVLKHLSLNCAFGAKLDEQL